jgi:hypothetical protein
MDDKQFQRGAVFCVQQEQNFLDLENTTARPEVQGERSYAFAILKSQPTLSKTLQKLLTDCMTASPANPQQNNMTWMTLFVKIFEPEHARLPPLMALVPAWINNPNTFVKMMNSFRKKTNYSSTWYEQLEPEFRDRFGLIHFTHDLNLTRVLTVNEQRQILRAPFVNHVNCWEFGDWGPDHEEMIQELFTKLQVDVAEKIFLARQELQGGLWYAIKASSPKYRDVSGHMHRLCDTDKELWRTKLDWSQCERGCWVDEVYDTSSIWMDPLISDDEMKGVSPELPKEGDTESAASALGMRLISGAHFKR